MENQAHPKMTVITVCFNSENCIEKTILSVLSQNYDNLEYVIIDGGSSDNTVSIIKSHADRISYWTSGKDGGIYFGMNKGIEAATGDYILFMNADDVFHNDNVVSEMAAFVERNDFPDAVYGDVEEETEYGVFHKTAGTLEQQPTKMVFSHQSIFLKSSLMKAAPFNTKYRYAADFEMLSRFYNEGARYENCGITVADVVVTGGATFDNYAKSVNEHFDILKSRGYDLEAERKSLLRRKKIVRTVKNCLPEFIEKPLFSFIAKHYKAL
ncbi:MAG: glycosyltransferase [Paludibacteraceae bacterium]|nr:glycosyltransferase [Paludibacteraceae bacterium]